MSSQTTAIFNAEILVNNLRVKALGLTIPPSLLQRADQVIE